jgi:hypothetical protein
MAVHKAAEHASARWFAYGRRNSRDLHVSVVFGIHGLMLDEVFLSSNLHTAANETVNLGPPTISMARRSRVPLNFAAPDSGSSTHLLSFTARPLSG